ncbi:MAG: serine protease [Rickettsiales bacterium]|jgi:serine protease Do|nr:serine protease [Rickettsiales bacterium]
MKNVRILAFILCLLAPIPVFAQKALPDNSTQITLSFAPLVKKSAPAVVNIYTRKKVVVKTLSLLDNDPFFRQFFGKEGQMPGKERVQSSLGSGVIIDPKGMIITNNHVVGGSDEITVVLSDRREFEAKVVLIDDRSDLALLEIDTKGEELPFLTLADSDQLEVGDLVLAIGNPFGVGQTVTSGIVSATARTSVGVSDYQFFIQTDAAINPGNSGGALVTTDGKLAGINTAIFTRSGGSNGIGFATPSNMVATIVSSQKHHGKIVRPWLGVAMQDVTQDIAKSLGLKTPNGALISQIFEDSPAKEANLQVGDIITNVGDHDVTNAQVLRFRIATYDIGKEVPFTILRKGEEVTAFVKMVAAPEKPKRDERVLNGEHLLEGATVANLSPALSDELRLGIFQEGVVITALKVGTLSTRIGIQPRDIILEVNQEKVTSTEQIEKLMRDSVKDPTLKGWQLIVLRQGQKLSIIVSK